MVAFKQGVAHQKGVYAGAVYKGVQEHVLALPVGQTTKDSYEGGVANA